ncbi:3-alpha domain-containing protein [Saccharococcus thermophilus]|uniref:MOSC domain-containing protein YiiM n=1 Tax=Saccharococcus thermophilus TaxID=29396 RepID=A0A846MB45_9BACL|nr:3-alpha domain-containing protein [Saccharococcus thermophilus]NIK14746.1 MOSC domain-containing protein YiiM [Saccharococcus thermophilus]
MKVISVNVGKPKTVMADGKPLTTGKTKVEAMQKIIAEPALSESWRNTFAKRLSTIIS